MVTKKLYKNPGVDFDFDPNEQIRSDVSKEKLPKTTQERNHEMNQTQKGSLPLLSDTIITPL